MTRIAAEIEYHRTGEVAVMEEMMTSHAPGSGHLAPDWAVTATRDATRARAMQRSRARGSYGGAAQDSDDGTTGRTRARRPRRQAASGAAGAGADGKGKAAAGPKAPAGGKGS